MKRIVILLLTLVIPLLFFSFLATTERGHVDDVYLFCDRDMPNRRIITGKLIRQMEDLGYRVRIDQFACDEINAYLIANPEALFLTARDIESDLFDLQRIPIVDVKIAVIVKIAQVPAQEVAVFPEKFFCFTRVAIITK